MSKMWNLWHGCKKYSDGCKYCYVYRGDKKYDRDPTVVAKTKNFSLPIEKKKNGEYKCPPGTFFYTCFTSDFLLDEADGWRIDAWKMIKERSDCTFLFITKRIERFNINLPKDWKDGYDNVIVCSTCENQDRADYRLPILNSLPIKHKVIILEPMLENMNIEKYLNDDIEEVVVGGESGYNARVCNYDWVLSIRKQCMSKNVTFHFKQTGAHFIKNNKLYNIPRRKQHSQAREANIKYIGKHKSYL